ncbi:methionine ABC transporter substrate-binding lipoprotein MetQ [Sphingobacterium paludis]|uniref:Lipoprotein n=1 Tax=Sphingobacterium paludis TaxID=1476465 RepID=A0A4R7CWD0_9SPHI|nr:methionine ABC transporter substrate-binding lipoprotein MetQ [Sphingobacterium paludis]TDS12167.1 D-methionine transport system substrate-binding protein [Sphingobacterium paludis]
MKLNLTHIAACMGLLATLLSCGGNQGSSDTLKVGVQAGPEFTLAETAKQVAKEKYNLDVELLSFNDYVMPNEALQQKDIDVNVFQTKPYLDVQTESRGYNFAIVGNTFVYPMAGYSKKIKNISELKNEDTIVIPNDPTNLGRALLLLQEVGLIKLKDDVGILPKLQDITENRLKLNILELEAPQLPRTLDDAKVTVAVINNNFAASNNLTAKRDGIFVENEKSPYVNIIVSREDNKNDEKIKNFTKAYQSNEVEAKAEEVFKGGAVKGW